ncbi:MAG: hypothetical protein OXG39_05805 [Chloroflexi bacterium]|nr:hypothetical protein [Chloroflexota bacterium]
MGELSQNDLNFYSGINEYCRSFNIPRDNLLEILEDQKVLPMIRGKASEFIGAELLRRTLDGRDWNVDKLNLNPSPATTDVDVRITFRMTGAIVKAEIKTAVRGSFRMPYGARYPDHRFKVKCHKSRSNLKRQDTSNDRYLVDDFDLLLCNVSNAIFRGKPLERALPLIDDPIAIMWLMEFYGVSSEEELVRSAYDDWRLCFPKSITDADGTIPRTPTVLMEGDSSWFKPDELPARLKEFVTQ